MITGKQKTLSDLTLELMEVDEDDWRTALHVFFNENKQVSSTKYTGIQT
jgi:hypothetical protein